MLSYAITARTKEFRPEFVVTLIPEIATKQNFALRYELGKQIPTIEEMANNMFAISYPDINVTLGESTLNVMNGWTPSYCYGLVGVESAAPYDFEVYNFGTKSDDLTYMIGINDNGYIDGDGFILMNKRISAVDCEGVSEDKRNQRVNTYIVSRLRA